MNGLSTGAKILEALLQSPTCSDSVHSWVLQTRPPVMWNFTSCEERKLTAIEFYYAMSGNKITCIVRKMGTRMTIKKFMEELTIHMTFSNQASRFQVYKPWDPVKYKPNTLITIK